jgi:hypothetical protein
VQILSEDDNANPESKEVDKTSSIYKLTPIKRSGILRVGGRIKAATYVSYDARFPVILKKDHPFTNLIIDEYHRMFAHQLRETCVNAIRGKYWISDLRACVKKAEKRCMECKIRSANPKPPRMGDLPAARLTPFVPPFTFTGMDLFGPVEVIVGRSRQKRWVVLYTCLTTRAIHLEIVRDLSTDSCILAFRCFRSIRPTPQKIYCDNGTNFVGMQRELTKCWKEWQDSIDILVQHLM